MLGCTEAVLLQDLFEIGLYKMYALVRRSKLKKIFKIQQADRLFLLFPSIQAKGTVPAGQRATTLAHLAPATRLCSAERLRRMMLTAVL